jgi:hypothetical protein
MGRKAEDWRMAARGRGGGAFEPSLELAAVLALPLLPVLLDVRPERRVVPAAGIGLALSNLAPKTRSIRERYIGNHRKCRSLARDWPAPQKLGLALS